MESTDLKTMREKFDTIARTHIQRAGIEDLLKWLGDTDFYTAPASGRYHGSCPGGLLEHSLCVYDNLLRVDRAYEFRLSAESMAICSLFHDLCKVNMYRPDTRNVKGEDGVWRKVPCYSIDEKFPFGGHGSKSMFIVRNFMPLEWDEAAAINCHMGAWDRSDYNRPADVYHVSYLAWALHVADEAATYVDGH